MTIAFNQLQELNSLIDRFATDCNAAVAIPSVRMYRTTAPQPPVPMAYSPGFAIVGQGAKNLVVGNERYRYGSGDYLLTAMDVPVITQIVEASERVPYFCMTLSFDTLQIVDLLHRLPNPPSDHGAVQRGVAVNPLTPELLDGAVRLLRLLDRPDQVSVLAPLIQEEMLFRLLTGPDGPRLRNIAMAGSQTHKIGRAIDWLRLNFARPLKVEFLADHVGMSLSSLHHHFKSFTAMTPVQYQKQLRLQEARRLMLVDKLDVASAGHQVGYLSPSQFSREYARLYGASPGRDISGIREAVAA